jgi:hypothetical protein
LAGYDSSDPKLTLEVKAISPEEQTNNDETPSIDHYKNNNNNKNSTTNNNAPDDMSEMSGDEPSDSMVDTALVELLEDLQPTSDMVLAIAEMCRVAERSVMENISQSIATHGGGGNKQRNKSGGGLFSGQKGHSANPTSERFRLAASRVLSLYAMNRGNEAAQILCSTLRNLSSNSKEPQASASSSSDAAENEYLEGPRAEAWQVLEIVKATSQDCADLFGGARRAGPVPDTLEDEYASLTMAMAQKQSASRSGLVFDVERMFAEKVVVYPHPSDISEFQRNPVVALVLKVAFKALGETVRLVQCSVPGYRQLLIDVEFFKWLIPHYVKDEFLADGSKAHTALMSLLTDAINTTKDRCYCVDPSWGDSESGEKNQARAAVRHFMSAHADDLVSKFIIHED